MLLGKVAIDMATGSNLSSTVGPDCLIAAAVLGYVATAIIQARRGKHE